MSDSILVPCELLEALFNGSVADGVSAFDKIRALIRAQPDAKEPKPVCTSCDDLGDYHDTTGEWRGYCTCEAGLKAKVDSESKPIGYRSRFKKSPERWMVNFQTTKLPDNPNPHADYELLFTHPAPAGVVQLPERRDMRSGSDGQRSYAMGWNACLDEIKRLNNL